MPTLAEAELAYQAGKLRKQRIYQKRNRAEGKCHSCSEPVALKYNGDPDTRCERHRAEGRRIQRIRYAQENPVAKQVTCGRCGAKGHNARTCESEEHE